VGRLLSLICGAVVILLTYHLGKEIAGPKVGLIASLLLNTSLMFSWHSREIRQDMMLLAFITLSIYFFYLAWNKKKDKFLFLSGFISTVSLQVHPNSAIFSLSILFIYALLTRRDVFSKSTLFLISGLSAGFVLWLFFNYLPYSAASFYTVHKKYIPPLFQENFFTVIGQSLINVPRIFSIKNLQWLSLKYHSSVFIGVTYFTLFLILVALLFGRNRKQLGSLLCFIIIPLFISGFVTGSWNWFHYSVFLSLYSTALAISIVIISDIFKTGKIRKLIPSAIILIIAISGIWDIMKNNIVMMKYDYHAFMNRVSTHVPEGATVLGASLYYPVFIERDNRFIGYLFLEERCPAFADKIKQLGIDYVLLDINLKVSSTLWCSERYYQSQIYDFLMNKRYIDIKANYPSRNRVMQSVYLFNVSE
jgi:4-amino-4-deoxy-L-arabinose transferase-like glycosyltransferase